MITLNRWKDDNTNDSTNSVSKINGKNNGKKTKKKTKEKRRKKWWIKRHLKLDVMFCFYVGVKL